MIREDAWCARCRDVRPVGENGCVACYLMRPMPMTADEVRDLVERTRDSEGEWRPDARKYAHLARASHANSVAVRGRARVAMRLMELTGIGCRAASRALCVSPEYTRLAWNEAHDETVYDRGLKLRVPRRIYRHAGQPEWLVEARLARVRASRARARVAARLMDLDGCSLSEAAAICSVRTPSVRAAWHEINPGESLYDRASRCGLIGARHPSRRRAA